MTSSKWSGEAEKEKESGGEGVDEEEGGGARGEESVRDSLKSTVQKDEGRRVEDGGNVCTRARGKVETARRIGREGHDRATVFSLPDGC
jgi:hypothetical protein